MLEPFVNIIDEVSDGHKIDRVFDDHEGITIHRVGYNHKYGIDLGETAAEICGHFTGRNAQYPEVAKATGGELAYTIMIGKAGVPWQCLPLSDIGHHARRWSYKTVGVAVIGDPRYVPLTNEQYWSLVDVCSIISRVLGTSSVHVKGHDELPGGMRDKTKECPGKLLSMSQLRHDVWRVMRASAEQEALRVGLSP